MKLVIASDHAGFELKEKLKGFRGDLAIEWLDLGPSDANSVDYPVYAEKLVKNLLASRSRAELLGPCGVLICGSGVGMSIAANRFKQIRAVLAFDPQLSVVSRQHNATNVLCLAGRILAAERAEEILVAWCQTKFEGGRHERRVNEMDGA